MKLAALILAIVLVVFGGCCGLLGLLTLIQQAGAGACALTSGAAVRTDGLHDVGAWQADPQVHNAAIIVATGQQLKVPARGWVIAVATAMEESSLINIPGGDSDSVGLFQQRPSQGWGTPGQLLDPVYAATQFYRKLLTINGWQQMPLTDAAQAVQQSAHPDAYARYEQDAQRVVAAVVPSGMAVDLDQCPGNCPSISTSGLPSSASDGCLDGQQVLARAASWLTAWRGGAVPYLSSVDPATWLGGYRRDCSGYASMALGLDGPGLDTAGLVAQSTPIPKAALRAGDLLINPALDGDGHVVIFDAWTDATMSAYVGYEQSGDGGTHHRTIPYPYFGNYQLSPYRYGK
ncbi:hypothetical protein [Dactylosporangium sp. CA-092794]|uniref:hypothetical protein n=1 Tax=Dactylosporangium sp. CA-092794 TaxID=3239929 RepID=UPI003D9221C2